MDELLNFLSTPSGILISLALLFFFCLYVNAYKKSQKGELIILNGKKDYYTLVMLLIIPVITLLFAKEEQEIIYLSAVVFLSLTVYTIWLSYEANKGFRDRILLSIGAKIFIISIILLIFLIRALEIILSNSDKKDKRFKDGIVGNPVTKAHARNRNFTDRFVKHLIK